MKSLNTHNFNIVYSITILVEMLIKENNLIVESTLKETHLWLSGGFGVMFFSLWEHELSSESL